MPPGPEGAGRAVTPNRSAAATPAGRRHRDAGGTAARPAVTPTPEDAPAPRPRRPEGAARAVTLRPEDAARAGPPLLEVTDLAVRFGPVRAVDGVSLRLAAGPFGLGLVGESGSGKSTIGRAVVRLVAAAGGQIRFEGKDVAALRGRALKEYRRAAQIVFQDPDNSLDPRMRIGASVAEPLIAHRIVARRRAAGRAPRAAGRGGARSGARRAGTRISYPAGSASASRSPGRSASSRGCWCWTSRPVPST